MEEGPLSRILRSDEFRDTSSKVPYIYIKWKVKRERLKDLFKRSFYKNNLFHHINSDALIDSISSVSYSLRKR